MKQDNYTERTIRKGLNSVPGMGCTARKFRVQMQVTQEMAVDLEELHGVEVNEEMHSQLVEQVTVEMSKRLTVELLSLPAKEIGIDDFVNMCVTNKMVEQVMVNSKIAAALIDRTEFTIATDRNLGNAHIKKIGDINQCEVYLNSLLLFDNNDAFVINENVVSLVYASEGVISDGESTTAIIEGMYNVSTQRLNSHYAIK